MPKVYIEVRAKPFRGGEELERDGKKYYIKTNLSMDDAAVRKTIDNYVNGEVQGLNVQKIRVGSQ